MLCGKTESGQNAAKIPANIVCPPKESLAQVSFSAESLKIASLPSPRNQRLAEDLSLKKYCRLWATGLWRLMESNMCGQFINSAG
jgi:hypothetical protein